MSKKRRFTGIKVKDELGKERLSMDTVSTPNLTVSELKEELDDEKKKEKGEPVTPRPKPKPKPKPKPLFSAKDERGIDRVVLDASTGNSSATDEEIAEDEDESDAIIDVRPLPAKDGKKAKPRPVKPKCGITVLDEYQKPRAEIATEDEEPEMTVGELLDKLAKAADGEGDP
ncbi:MAG: hypothetical protein VXW43_19830, partial [Pseudomonadota bacterium]|nr:hypothetical protein [Pseudomonadota bacterium]